MADATDQTQETMDQDTGEEQQGEQVNQEQIDRAVKKRLEQERRKFEREKQQLLKQYENVDPNEYQQLKEKQKQAEDEKLRKDGEFEKLREKWSKEREQEKQKYEEKIQNLNSQLDNLYLKEKVKNSALQAGVDPADVDDVLTITWNRFQRDDEGNILVLDREGEISPLTPEDFFAKDFKEAKPKFYKPDVLPGGGTSSSANNPTRGKTVSRQDFDSMDAAAKKSFIDKGGQITDQ